MVKKISVIEGVLSTLQAIEEPEFREFSKNDVIGDITIDTVKAFDIGMFETGIKRMSIEGKWIIVEQYKDRKEAQKGHNKWVELMRKNSKVELKDINLWNI